MKCGDGDGYKLITSNPTNSKQPTTYPNPSDCDPCYSTLDKTPLDKTPPKVPPVPTAYCEDELGEMHCWLLNGVLGGGESPRCSGGKCVTRLSRSAGAAGYKSADVIDMSSYMQAVRQPK